MIGDQKRDEETAINAGGQGYRIGKAECLGIASVSSLLEAVEEILGV